MCQQNLRSLIFVGLSIVLGVGAIKLPGLLAGKLGIYQIFSWGFSLIFCLISAHFISKTVIKEGFINFLKNKVGYSTLFIYVFAYLVILSALSIAMAKSISLVIEVKEKYMATVILCIVYLFSLQKFIKKFQEFIAKIKILMFGIILILLFSGPQGINLTKINIIEVLMSSSITFWSFIGFECLSFEREARGKVVKNAIIWTLLLSFLIYVLIVIFFSFTRSSFSESEAIEYALLQKGKVGVFVFFLIVLALFGSSTGVFYFVSELIAHLKIKKVNSSNIVFLLSLALLWLGNFKTLVEISSTIIISVFLVAFPKMVKNQKEKILLFILTVMASIMSPYLFIIFSIVVTFTIVEYIFAPKESIPLC